MTPKARYETTTLPELPGTDGHASCAHTQGSHIFIHLERMEKFSQLTGFIMMETRMVIYLGCCFYKKALWRDL